MSAGYQVCAVGSGQSCRPSNNQEFQLKYTVGFITQVKTEGEGTLVYADIGPNKQSTLLPDNAVEYAKLCHTPATTMESNVDGTKSVQAILCTI